MLRRFYLFGVALALAGGMLVTSVSSNEGAEAAAAQSGLTVKVTPWGPTQELIDRIKKQLPEHADVRRYLKGARVRVLSFEILDAEEKMSRRPLPPERYRAEIFSYDNNRAVEVYGSFDSSAITVSLMKRQSEFCQEEFEEAVAILQADGKYGEALRSGALSAYRPMPPIADGEAAPERVERTVNVGLMPRDGSQTPEIVGVNMIRRLVMHFPNRAPKTAIAVPNSCGLGNAGQSTTARGTAGQFEVVVSDASGELWRMLVIRPSASSGTRASAVEVRNVDYRGKRVLGRAHAPILNVQYDNNACGPYRDWQWQEGSFDCTGTDVAAGFRQCNTRPLTILDDLQDQGNFRGVAIFIQNNDILLVSELEAGWYRYISEWRFTNKGIIQPRFGFGGVQNSCVCNAHNHHVYWRFDFDIRTPANNIVYGPGLRWWPSPIPTEVKMTRSATADNRLNVQNLVTGETYMIVPGLTDGIADVYARGDIWVLAGKGTGELDDGHNSTGGSTEARLDNFVTGESVQNADIVIWYAAHFYHVIEDTNPHIVGPDLIPVLW